MKALAITQKVSEFIVLDAQPTSVVEDEGFCRLLEDLEPRYSLPSRKYFSGTTELVDCPYGTDALRAQVPAENVSHSVFLLRSACIGQLGPAAVAIVHCKSREKDCKRVNTDVINAVFKVLYLFMK